MVTPSTSPPCGSSDTRSPGAPPSERSPDDARRARPSRARSEIREPGLEDDRRPAGQLGERQQADIGQRVIDPRAAEGADDDEAVRAPREGGADRQLRVGLVLVRAGQLDRHARRGQRGQAGLTERVAVTHPQVDDDAEIVRVPRPAVGGDDQVDPVGPVRPGRIESSARRGVAIGQDQGDHRANATRCARPARPGRACRSGPAGPMLDSGPCPKRPSIPRSSASSTPPPGRA